MVFVLSLLLLAPQDEDLRKKVRVLVEQLQSDEIQAVDDAVTGLVALGPPALGSIREELARAAGDAKLRLAEALRAIERNARRTRALGTPLLVSLDARDRPLGDVLEEIRKATAQPIVWKELPAGNVTVALEKTAFWEALDRVCKAHGGIMWSVKEKEIVLTKRTYRDLPKVFRGNQVVYFDSLSSDRRRYGAQVHPSTSLEGGVAWIRGAVSPRADLQIEEFRDDQGTDLFRRPGGAFVTFSLGEESAPSPEVLTLPLSFQQSVTLHDDAKTLDRLKGEVKLEYILDSRRIAMFDKPQASVGKSLRAGALTVLLRRFIVSDQEVDVRIHVTVPNAREKVPIRTGGFRLLDPQGKAHGGNGSVDEEADEDTGKVEYDITLDFSLPEKFEIAALEFTVPTELETIVIPFDFKGLPLR